MSAPIKAVSDIQDLAGTSAFSLRLFTGASVLPGDLVPPATEGQLLFNQTTKTLFCPVPGMPGQFFQFPLEGSLLANAYYATSPGVSTTTSTTFQTKASLSEIFPAGNYLVLVTYQWNYDATGTDFEARVRVNGVPEGQIHKQEPQDSGGSFGATGTDQRHTAILSRIVSLNGSETVDVQFRSSSGGTEASMFETVIVAINLDTL